MALIARACLDQIRADERFLLLTWCLGLGLCVATGTGSQTYVPVFTQYVVFFGRYIIYLFAATRLLMALDERWHPAHPLLVRLKAWTFGAPATYQQRFGDALVLSTPGSHSERSRVLGMDLLFLRLALLLFANLTVYSNIKLHIPFINQARGDEFFRHLDEVLFGEHLIEAIEKWFSENSSVAEYFASVYMHDYIWMVVIVLILYLRRDWFSLRWTVMSVCFTYMVGILITVAYPSWGPCFVAPERFEWLQGSEIGHVQSSLANALRLSTRAIANDGSFDVSAFMGIAAFPSLHVAHMVIILIVAMRTIPIYALWMLWATLGTFIATIGFGWHYAVDGLGGAVLAVVVTEGLRRLLLHTERTRHSRNSAKLEAP